MAKEYNYHTRIMGCDFDMTFIAKTVAQADRYFTQANNIAKSFEKRFSRFDTTSELSFVNKNKSVEVSQEFLEVYWIAYDLYKKTHKRFNPLVKVSCIGYDKTFEKITDCKIDNLDENEYNINLDDVVILPHRMVLQDSQNLDFGGFLKGHVAQHIAENINSGYGIIINIGGDMYVRGSGQDGKKFIVEIAHPEDESKNISFSVLNKSLCTSGTYKRTWTSHNGKKHHILDTQTKDSTRTDIISASVIHKKGAIADAYATLAVILGSQKAKKFFDEQQIDFIFICSSGDIIISDNFK